MARRVTPQLLGRLAGAFFLVLGILGFLPAVTRHSSQLRFWNSQAGAELFGVFRVGGLLDALRIGIGVLGLTVSRTAVGARLFLIWAGLGSFALWLYGAAIRGNSGGRALPFDAADNWLRLGVSMAMLTLAWIAAVLDVPVASSQERAALEELERAGGEGDDLLGGLGWLALRRLELDEAALRGATRRAILLLAAGGDPRRGLTLDGRAVTSLADELDHALRQDELGHSLELLRLDARGLPRVSSGLSELASDPALARRAVAAGLLADELSR